MLVDQFNASFVSVTAHPLVRIYRNCELTSFGPLDKIRDGFLRNIEAAIDIGGVQDPPLAPSPAGGGSHT